MSEISRSLFCECGHSIRFHHDGKGIYAKGCNQPLGMGMECPCTLDWGTSQPTDQIRDLTAELKELREFVGAMETIGNEECIGHWNVSRDSYVFVDSDYNTIATGTDPFDAWRKMNAGEGE